MRLIRLKKGDFVALAILAAALIAGGLVTLVMGRADGAPIAQVIVDGEVADTIPLSGAAAEERTYVSSRGVCIVRIEDGRICILESDCPDQVCVHTGWLTRAGQSAVCAPNRIAVVVRGAGAEVDAVVG
jgi:hypothetical protein